MTALVYTNKLTWFQDDGEPLKNGYIYVGDPNQDPRTFPKTVTFTDSAGNSFPAEQPLRTNQDGRIHYNGKAITATVDGDFSLLIIKSDNKSQIRDGYVPSVEDFNAGSGSSNIDNYREYALTLADTKQLEKSPGQTVGSVGKNSTEDTEGANWLVVSNTGNTADDIDLIDFDNGTQGKRLRNFLQPQDNLDNLTDYSAARGSMDVYSTSESDAAIAAFAFPEADYEIQRGVNLGGDFSGSDEIDIVRVRDLVTISVSSGATLSFAAATTASSSVGVLPADFRPPNTVRVATFSDAAATNGVIQTLEIQSNGTIRVIFRPRDGSSSATQTSAEAFCISFIAA